MKNKLRTELINIRKKLEKEEVLYKSKKIQKNLEKIKEFKQATEILFYISYGNEVYTHDIIKKYMKNRKKILVPVTDKKRRNLIISEINDWEDLGRGVYNILEPKKENIKKRSLEFIDVIIVPGVAFDVKGNRIGHGKGYYDKLLKKSKNAVHIALSFEKQIIDKIPTKKSDIPVDKIVTEERIIDCKKARL